MNITAQINPVYLANVTAKLDSVQTAVTNTTASVNSATLCSELDALNGASAEILAEFNKYKKTIEDFFTDQLAEIVKSLSGLLPLISIPNDLPGVITWVTNFITNLKGPYDKILLLQTEMLAQQAIYVAKLATLVTNISDLQSAILAKSSTLSCGLTTPPAPSVPPL